MKKNLILMMLLLTGAVSMNAQELLYDGPKVVVAGNVVNSGKITSNIPIELRGENAKIDNLEGAESEIFAAGMIVGAGTLVDNKGTLIVGEAPRELVIGSNHYSIGDFGEAGVWMTENLREVPAGGSLNSGTSYIIKYYNIPQMTGIPNVSDADTIAKYGYLYSWAAAMNLDDSQQTTPIDYTQDLGNNNGQAQVQGICPSGWHLPSDYEWTLLEKTIAMDASNCYSLLGAIVAADTIGMATAIGYRVPFLDKRFRAATNTWIESGGFVTGGSNPADKGGFWVLPAGQWRPDRPDIGAQHFGNTGYYWSSSSGDDDTAWRRLIGIEENEGVSRGLQKKTWPFSIRCKKN